MDVEGAGTGSRSAPLGGLGLLRLCLRSLLLAQIGHQPVLGSFLKRQLVHAADDAQLLEIELPLVHAHVAGHAGARGRSGNGKVA